MSLHLVRTLGAPPSWTSLRYLRDDAARAAELVDAILERFEQIGYVGDDVQAERDEQALDWAEGEQARAHAWLGHRERELVAALAAHRSRTTKEA